MIDRGDYWQCAYVIPKGAADEIRRKGLPSLRDEIATLIPFARDRVGELGDWSEIKLLTVRVDRLRRWYRPGLLCIGDAAHAMSPIGGVGINLAVQDAVAAANILASPLRQGAVATDHLRAVQRRRELPTRLTQRLQVFLQDRVIRRVLSSSAAALAATASEADAAMAVAAPHPRARGRHWVSARAREGLRRHRQRIDLSATMAKAAKLRARSSPRPTTTSWNARGPALTDGDARGCCRCHQRVRRVSGMRVALIPDPAVPIELQRVNKSMPATRRPFDPYPDRLP